MLFMVVATSIAALPVLAAVLAGALAAWGVVGAALVGFVRVRLGLSAGDRVGAEAVLVGAARAGRGGRRRAGWRVRGDLFVVWVTKCPIAQLYSRCGRSG
ncbi:hypothetical protein Acsp04_51610 [Actinomadura sp. NBRC 104425]|nr:hypothetical protein Acsp04_51610 [Actinomadura sp. NBRC 104425]